MDAKLGKEATDLLTQIGNQLQEAGFQTRIFKISSDDWNRKAITGQLSNDYDMLIGKWSFGINEDVNDLFQTRSETKFQGGTTSLIIPIQKSMRRWWSMKRLEQPIRQRMPTINFTLNWQMTYHICSCGNSIPSPHGAQKSKISPSLHTTTLRISIVGTCPSKCRVGKCSLSNRSSNHLS